MTDRSTDRTPIFVCGAARSGTTMLGATLGRHSQCLAVPEATFVADALRRFHPIESADPRELLRFVVASPRHRLWETPLDTESVGVAELGASPADVVRLVIDNYARAHDTPAYEHWIDHTPLNVRHAAALLRLFPGARMIHIVRDGRAVAASVLPLDWGACTADAAARTWLIALAYGLAAESVLGPQRVLRVRYEDLVREPGRTLRELCDWLGLSFEEALVASAGGLDLPRHTREQHRLVGGKPDASRIEAWREALSPREIEQFEAIAAQMLEHLGYEPLHGTGARPRTRRERRADTFRTLWRQEVTDRRRRTRRWRR